MKPYRPLRTVYIALLAALVTTVPALAKGGSSRSGSVHVRGYTTSRGTYVAPHSRSSPDGSFYNNWSTKGNINPFTGELGTRVSPPGTATPNYRHSSPTYGYSSGSFYGGSNALPSVPSVPSRGAAFPPSFGSQGGQYPPPSSVPSPAPAMPSTPSDWLTYADQARSAGDLKSAVFALGNAIALDPSDESIKRLSKAYLDLAKASPTQQSFQFLHRSLAICPSTEAEEYLKEVIRKSKRNPDSYKQRMVIADIAKQLEDYIGEVVEYKAALELKRNDVDTLLKLATAYQHVGLTESADETLNSALSLGAKKERIENLRQRIVHSPSKLSNPLPNHYFANER